MPTSTCEYSRTAISSSWSFEFRAKSMIIPLCSCHAWAMDHIFRCKWMEKSAASFCILSWLQQLVIPCSHYSYLLLEVLLKGILKKKKKKVIKSNKSDALALIFLVLPPHNVLEMPEMYFSDIKLFERKYNGLILPVA